MARKLKTYQTSLGFYDLALAAARSLGDGGGSFRVYPLMCIVGSGSARCGR